MRRRFSKKKDTNGEKREREKENREKRDRGEKRGRKKEEREKFPWAFSVSPNCS